MSHLHASPVGPAQPPPRRTRGVPELDVSSLAQRLQPLLVQRLGAIVLEAERGELGAIESACAVVTALDALATLASPERRGRLLTATEVAERLGVTVKSVRRMVQQRRLTPAVHSGRFLRFTGSERPVRGGSGR